MKKIIFGAIVIFTIFTIGAKAEPVINSITLDPTNPSPKSTITFTADITGDQLDEVYLILQECKEDLCFQRVNESMTKTGTNTFEVTMTLTKSSSTYIQYWIEINEDGDWYGSDSDLTKKNLSTQQEDSSPGFELLVFLVSLVILLFIIKKKRR
jgi:hypothetical protein